MGLRHGGRRYVVGSGCLYGVLFIILLDLAFIGRGFLHLRIPGLGGNHDLRRAGGIGTLFLGLDRLGPGVNDPADGVLRGLIGQGTEEDAPAGLGLLGGYATPVMLSTGQADFIGLYGYLLLLGAGTLGIAAARRWHLLNALSFLANYLLVFLSIEEHYRPELFWTVMPFIAASISASVGSFFFASNPAAAMIWPDWQ